MEKAIKITECPRDAMQGLAHFVPTELKATYINLLLQVGFDTIDFGSFVSPKAIPQMRDTADVLKMLNLKDTRSKLLAIAANYRGAEEAAEYGEINILGYPFSISETFQQRNTNSGVNEAFETVKRIKALCESKNKQLLIYLSMGFGNPYGDAWSPELVFDWAGKLTGEGITSIALADTVGVATALQISNLYPQLVGRYPATEFGIHLHSTPADWEAKIAAAYASGCRHFDTAIKGYGGCPMAKDELTGNIATENVVDYLKAKNIDLEIDYEKLKEVIAFSDRVFS